MDQLVKVARHPSSEGIHHEVQPFLHHLQLRDHVWWSRIYGGWTACILSLLSAWGVAAFQPFLIFSLSAGTVLVLLLSAKSCVLLAQLLF